MRTYNEKISKFTCLNTMISSMVLGAVGGGNSGGSASIGGSGGQWGQWKQW